MKIEQVSVGVLKPAKYNPRTWNESQIKGLKASIKEFGIIDPIIVNSNNKRINIVIGGHFRLHIAKQMGFKKVPVVSVNLDAKKEKALNIALNNPHITGDWTTGLEVLLNDIKLDLPDLFIDLNLDLLVDDIPEAPIPMRFPKHRKNRLSRQVIWLCWVSIKYSVGIRARKRMLIG